MPNKKSDKGFTPALGYNWLTNVYDTAIKITMPEKKFRNRLIDIIHPLPGEKILEFGFGTAQNIILLKKRCADAQVQGVDIDPKIKWIAERKLDEEDLNIELFLYNGSMLPFEDNSFDKIFSCLVFHHLDKDTKMKCLLEINRVLKTGGKLTICDWGKAETTMMRFAFYAVQLVDGFTTTADNVKGLLNQYILNAGFKEVEIHSSINTEIGTLSYYKAVK